MRIIEVRNQAELDAAPHREDTQINIRGPWKESFVIDRAEPDSKICAFTCSVTVVRGTVDVFGGAAIVRGEDAAAILHTNSRGSCSDGGYILAHDTSIVDVHKSGYALLDGNAVGCVFAGGRISAAGASRVSVQMGGYAELRESATGTILCRGTAVGYNTARMIVAPGAYIKRGDRGGIPEKGVTLERLRLEGAPKRKSEKKEKPPEAQENVPDGQEVFGGAEID